MESALMVLVVVVALVIADAWQRRGAKPAPAGSAPPSAITVDLTNRGCDVRTAPRRRSE